MKTNFRFHVACGFVARTGTAIAATALLASLCAAQTPPTPPTPPSPPQPSISDRDRAQTEMRELFAKVERRLHEIDRLLSDAGAGDTAALSGVKKAGIDELLRTSETRQREVLQAIDRILEIARENQRSGGSSSSPPNEPQPGSQSPLDKQGNPTTEREETPSAPKSSQSPKDGEKPGEKPGDKNKDGSQKKGEKPEPGDTDPRDGRQPPNKSSKNSPGPNPPGQATDAASKADGKDRWGDLPVKVRDVFRTEGGSDMPVQYREWIDSYYRRLNKKP